VSIHHTADVLLRYRASLVGANVLGSERCHAVVGCVTERIPHGRYRIGDYAVPWFDDR
jgi:hypothetical protein